MEKPKGQTRRTRSWAAPQSLGVDAALILKRTDRYRTLQSSQRYGADWPETVLEFDSERRALSLGAEKSEAEAKRIGQAILDYLRGSEEPRTREEIEAHVEGKTGPTQGSPVSS